MNKKHGLLFGFAVIAIAAIVTFTGCKLDDEEEEKESGPSPTGITYNNTASYPALDIAFTGLRAFNNGGDESDFVVTVDGTATTLYSLIPYDKVILAI